MSMDETNQIEMSEITDPALLSQARKRWQQAERNSAWLQAHVPEIYARHRGKCICVAGEELFVANDAREATALARAAHPEDEGALLRYIPKEKMERIYFAAGILASV
jgi:hypothetical protein